MPGVSIVTSVTSCCITNKKNDTEEKSQKQMFGVKISDSISTQWQGYFNKNYCAPCCEL